MSAILVFFAEGEREREGEQPGCKIAGNHDRVQREATACFSCSFPVLSARGVALLRDSPPLTPTLPSGKTTAGRNPLGERENLRTPRMRR